MTNKVLDIYNTVAYGNDIDPLSGDLNKEQDRKKIERYLSKKLDSINEDNKAIVKNNTTVTELLAQDIPKLEFKINKLVEKIKGAILVERKTTSTIYSTIIPITTQYTNTETTTATVKENVIFGLSNTKIDYEDINVLNISNIIFKNLNIKKLSGSVLENLTISNLTHNTLPFEFTINLNNLVNSSSEIILDLANYAIIEIYKDNTLYREKELSNYFSIPVDKENDTVTIRSYPTMHKSTDLHINILGITDLIYQDSTIYESKDISIGESLSYLVLDTCDNTLTSDVKIDYSIALNGGKYERINTIHSYKDKNNIVQSVIGLSKDSELNLLSLSGIKRSEGDIQYILPEDTQNHLNYELEVYLKNISNKKQSTYWILVKEDITMFKSYFNVDTLLLDNNEVVTEEFIIPKGLRKIVFSSYLFNYDYLRQTIGDDNIFSDKLLKPILKKNDYKYVSLNNIELLNAFNSTDINNIYIKNLKKQVFVSTIKLKAELTSIDKKTVPFISRFLIRGI